MTSESAQKNSYKYWFDLNPYDQFPAVASWAEFRSLYQKHQLHLTLPVEAPSLIGDQLREKDLFHSSLKQDIIIFQHLNYTPDFLHKLEGFKIIYVEEGQARFTANSHQYQLKSGNCCIVPPQTSQSLFTCDDQTCVFNVIIRSSTFQQAFSSMLHEENELTGILWQMLHANRKPILMCPKDISKTAMSLIKQLHHEEEARLNYQNTIQKGLVMIFLASFWREYAQDILVLEQSVDDRRLARIFETMDRKLSNITLTELAQQMQLSEGYLSRYFKQATNQTFKQALKAMRLNKAAYYLEYSHLSIERICELIGYQDQSHFYRNFKDTYQVTPNYYRKKTNRDPNV